MRKWTTMPTILLACALLGGCPPPPAEEAEVEGETAAVSCLAATSVPDPASPNLQCPAPPNTFDISGFYSISDGTLTPTANPSQAGPTWDAWAWASFAAMSWPALTSTDTTTYPSGYVRGVPNESPGTTFAAASPTDVLVWETFKEKREVFNDSVQDMVDAGTYTWQNVTFSESQSPDSLGGEVPACSDADTAALAQLQPGHFRILAQGSELSPSISESNTLDETAEVASQAREAASVLCAGYDTTTTPTEEQCLDQLFPDSDLDGRPPVGPRVWQGDPGATADANPVYYEVKVNYDFFDYISENMYWDYDTAVAAAASAEKSQHPKLPFRTSATSAVPPNSPNRVVGYDASSVASEYTSSSLDPNAPPGIGSVHLKAAWLLLDGPDSSYHTTQAVYFKTDDNASDPDQVCYDVATFGLLGLHIIQRVHAIASGSFESTGGTFVFATWERVGLGAYNEPTDYYYANYLANPDSEVGVFDTDATPFPNYGAENVGAIPLVRTQDYPLASTQQVNQAVWNSLPADSVWRNYQLIGTQFVALGSESEASTYNLPYYLANLVVESNVGLQQFQGLPPNVVITDYYTQTQGIPIQGTQTDFARDQPNTIFAHNPVNMGGCMGCHGVAQVQGFNFSFVFLDGVNGAGIDTQTHFEIPPFPTRIQDEDGGS